MSPDVAALQTVIGILAPYIIHTDIKRVIEELQRILETLRWGERIPTPYYR